MSLTSKMAPNGIKLTGHLKIVHMKHNHESNCLDKFFSLMWLAGVQHYNEIKDISICEFLPPHLVIYVDLPAEEVQKRLKQSGKVGGTHTETPRDTVFIVGY